MMQLTRKRTKTNDEGSLDGTILQNFEIYFPVPKAYTEWSRRGGFRTTQAQTSPRIRAVWSAPLLFEFWKVPYLSLLQAKFHFSS